MYVPAICAYDFLGRVLLKVSCFCSVGVQVLSSALCLGNWFQEAEPIASPPKFIDTASDLAELCDLLKMEKEIAVDLEVSGHFSLTMRI